MSTRPFKPMRPLQLFWPIEAEVSDKPDTSKASNGKFGWYCMMTSWSLFIPLQNICNLSRSEGIFWNFSTWQTTGGICPELHALPQIPMFAKDWYCCKRWLEQYVLPQLFYYMWTWQSTCWDNHHWSWMRLLVIFSCGFELGNQNGIWQPVIINQILLQFLFESNNQLNGGWWFVFNEIFLCVCQHLEGSACQFICHNPNFCCGTVWFHFVLTLTCCNQNTSIELTSQNTKSYLD